MTGIPTGRAVTAGDVHSCMVSDNGKVYCWGNDGVGQIGDDDRQSGTVETAVRTAIDTSELALAESVVDQVADVNQLYTFIPPLTGVADE